MGSLLCVQLKPSIALQGNSHTTSSTIALGQIFGNIFTMQFHMCKILNLSGGNHQRLVGYASTIAKSNDLHSIAPLGRKALHNITCVKVLIGVWIIDVHLFMLSKCGFDFKVVCVCWMWWCIVLNVLCPAIWINRFALLGYISVSTIDLLGPGQHWDCDGAFNDMVCLLLHRIHFLSWNRETSLGCSFRWASPLLWFTMEQTKCL